MADLIQLRATLISNDPEKSNLVIKDISAWSQPIIIYGQTRKSFDYLTSIFHEMMDSPEIPLSTKIKIRDAQLRAGGMNFNIVHIAALSGDIGWIDHAIRWLAHTGTLDSSGVTIVEAALRKITIYGESVMDNVIINLHLMTDEKLEQLNLLAWLGARLNSYPFSDSRIYAFPEQIGLAPGPSTSSEDEIMAARFTVYFSRSLAAKLCYFI